ncbi:hypothetical protein F0L74_09580 [Chitinophaga agrisoli]|uniref:Uncharacterized protein n=1 Tax=Chitinophaga agrisoli TaxID=2607653 RepID=A0A5B2VVZ9_9BACT|nr:hypothetical protein [Chitinophaga agrisoli]KAA2242768.1 hypothetical protein F0L74_09580 [Chitinophaga agrisoli]
MIFRYLSTKEFVLDNIQLQFGASRESVRAQLGRTYEEQNRVIPLGGTEPPIIVRNDIYDDSESTGDFFSLNYDKDDLLMELEIHHCDGIQIFEFSFDFNDEMETIATGLSKYAPITRNEDGEWFFKDLHISMTDEMHMGGEESSTMGYFYYALNVSHLEERDLW